MKRREALTGMGAACGAIAMAGCIETIEEIATEASEEAEDEVGSQIDDIERPPGADVTIRDGGTVFVRSLDPGTLGVKCGHFESNDPTTEIEVATATATTEGAQIEACGKRDIVAVNEAGDVDIVEENPYGESEDESESPGEGVAGPPGADVNVRSDGIVHVQELNAGTVGVKCGHFESEDPLFELEVVENTATNTQEQLENCGDSPIVAVNEDGETAVVEEP